MKKKINENENFKYKKEYLKEFLSLYGNILVVFRILLCFLTYYILIFETIDSYKKMEEVTLTGHLQPNFHLILS